MVLHVWCCMSYNLTSNSKWYWSWSVHCIDKLWSYRCESHHTCICAIVHWGTQGREHHCSYKDTASCPLLSWESDTARDTRQHSTILGPPIGHHHITFCDPSIESNHTAQSEIPARIRDSSRRGKTNTDCRRWDCKIQTLKFSKNCLHFMKVIRTCTVMHRY